MRAFLLREPLVHFLVLAGLLFAVFAVTGDKQRDVISLDATTQQYLINLEEERRLRPLTPTERDALLERYIREEILIREARKNGLDNTATIRKLTLQNMHYFLGADLPEPDEQSLREHFGRYPERFLAEPSTDFEQVFFAGLEEVSDGALARLNSGADFRSMGDVGRYPSLLRNVNIEAMITTFGPITAPKILAISDQSWHGPFLSDDGAHYLRVIARNEPVMPRFEDIKAWVEEDWIALKTEERLEAELEAMRANYVVDRQLLQAAKP